MDASPVTDGLISSPGRSHIDPCTSLGPWDYIIIIIIIYGYNPCTTLHENSLGLVVCVCGGGGGWSMFGILQGSGQKFFGPVIPKEESGYSCFRKVWELCCQ